MATHDAHVHSGQGPEPILFDGCPRCEEQAGELGIWLDGATWRRAWERMVEVEFEPHGFYRSGAEAKLGGDLYRMCLVLHRNTTVDTRFLFEPTRPSSLPVRAAVSGVDATRDEGR